MLARDKHSTLLQTLINYGGKSFITLSPGSTVVIDLTHIPKFVGSIGRYAECRGALGYGTYIS